MITRVRVKNFRSLADVDVKLGPLTVLVGRNGAGKSAFIDALRFVRDMLRYNVDTAFEMRNGFDAVIGRVPRGESKEIEIVLLHEHEGTFIEYSLHIGADKDYGHTIIKETCCTGTNPEDLTMVYQAGNGMVKGYTAAWPFKVNPMKMPGILGNGRVEYPQVALKLLISSDLNPFLLEVNAADFYTLYPDNLRTPQPASQAFVLSENAANLASVLDSMLAGASRRNIVSLMKLFIEDIEDIRVEEVGSYLAIRIQHKLKDGTSYWLDLAHESDGTIRVLSLLAALFQESGHKLMAIEEPELFLYPSSLCVMSDIIKESALSYQIIITTQSPDFISEFAAEALRVVERKEGMTIIGPLLPHQLDILNRELFTTGDLMRVEGLRTTPFETVSAADV